jgi:DNA-binding transcriptional ArsR family regulator
MGGNVPVADGASTRGLTADGTVLLFNHSLEWLSVVDGQAKQRFKGELFAQFARVGRALSNPHRLELLDLLAQGERAVEQLAVETDLSLANASQHLQVLRQAELVLSRRAGSRVLYRLASGEVFALWQALRAAGEARLAEIDRVVAAYLSDRAQLEAIGPEELLRRLADGEVTLIDVRPDLHGPDESRRLAAELHGSLRKLAALPDDLEVYPSHFAGSACGKAMSGKPPSTLGFERRFNEALRPRSREQFVAFMTTDLPPQPEEFARIRRINRGLEPAASGGR